MKRAVYNEADLYYKRLISKVLSEGVSDEGGSVRPVYADGAPAYSKSIFGEQVVFEPGVLPVVTVKRTPIQSSINEVVHAFFRMKTNKVRDFEELGIGYWKEWEMDDGTIGMSYGKQLAGQKEDIEIDGKLLCLNQVESIIHRMAHDPQSRRIMFSYWNPEHVHMKALQECAYAGQFNIRKNIKGKYQLDFLLTQRSVDLLLGLPSNWAGYYALQCAFANLFGFEVGRFVHQMGNVHLYDNQYDLAEKLLYAPSYEAPTIYVNKGVTRFEDYTVDDIKYVDYESGESVRSEVAR